MYRAFICASLAELGKTKALLRADVNVVTSIILAVQLDNGLSIHLVPRYMGIRVFSCFEEP
jgi:hypothetical protein